MNQQQTHADGVSIIGNRKVYPEQSHGFGSTGFGRLGFGSPRWATATSFHPYYVKPGSHKRLDAKDETRESARTRLPIIPPQDHSCIIAHPSTEAISNPCITEFSAEGHSAKVARATMSVQALLERHFKACRLKTKKPGKTEVEAMKAEKLRQKQERYSPGIPGLDLPRTA